jgi:hypothetical protein
MHSFASFSLGWATGSASFSFVCSGRYFFLLLAAFRDNLRGRFGDRVSLLGRRGILRPARNARTIDYSKTHEGNTAESENASDNPASDKLSLGSSCGLSVYLIYGDFQATMRHLR